MKRHIYSLAYAALLASTPLPAAVPSPAPAFPEQPLSLAEQSPDPATRDKLKAEIAVRLAESGDFERAARLGSTSPPYDRAVVAITIAGRIPTSQPAELTKWLLEAQQQRTLTHDWHQSRIDRLLAVAHARLDRFDTAVALAKAVPDTEDRAFALQAVVAALSQAGDVARARELAGSIEENRRFGTYRQKAEALASVAAALHRRGDSDGAATLLAQAALLLPKKPGWSDGGALRAVAVAQHACGETAVAEALLTRAEDLARAIAGPWKVSELTQVAAAWRRCDQAARADQRLADAAAFLATLTVTDRLPEALTLARAQFAAGQPEAARKLLAATLAEVSRLANPDVARAPHVRTLLTWAELFGSEPLPTT